MSDTPNENNNEIVNDNEGITHTDEHETDHQSEHNQLTEEELNEEADYQQNELYKSVLNQQSSVDVAKSMEDHAIYKKKEYSNKLPTLSRSSLKRSVSLKPTMQYTVINEIKYIGEQIKVGKFDPNSRSLNEDIFQKYYQKRLAEVESKRKFRPSSSTSQRSTINPSLLQTNDFKYKGNQFKHGKYISTIDLTKQDGRSLITSSSFTNETTFEEKFQKMFSPRLEKLMPKEKPKVLSYFELKELHERLTLNRR